MPSPTITPNRKTAVLDGHGGLDSVLWTTTASSHGKDNSNVYIRRKSA